VTTKPVTTADTPRRTPGRIVGGMLFVMSGFLAFFTWPLWDSLVLLWERPLREYLYFSL
jgi:hypothetical protein